MTIIHNLGFPRVGKQRELKRALEAYWAGSISQEALLQTGRELRARHWQLQAQAGQPFVPVGDFAWYDHILEWSTLLGAVPARFEQDQAHPVSLDTLFRMARGHASSDQPAAECEMTKWFDTNYHYMVPELVPEQEYRIARTDLFEQIQEALDLGYQVKPVIPGPLSWLWLGKGDAYHGLSDTKKLALLVKLLPVYRQVLARFKQQGIEWVQIDEPILSLDLPEQWQAAFTHVYEQLQTTGLKLLLTTYFEGLRENIKVVRDLPVDGIHVDLARAPEGLADLLAVLGPQQILSAGVICGRNIWRADLDQLAAFLLPAKKHLGERLWLAPSCSLLHVPVDLEGEIGLDKELYSWLSFATQKLEELELLRALLDGDLSAEQTVALENQRAALHSRRISPRTQNPLVRKRMSGLEQISLARPPFAQRTDKQRLRLGLPVFPTTTVGSFPQTLEIRTVRRDWRDGSLSDAAYEKAIRAQIETAIRFQEQVGLDVLVHGEVERNDMVEYFGELLGGFAFTQNGWVQCYGSRCVKPPILFGDVIRPAPITVAWTQFAQSLTDSPVKGVLTGPVTMLQWSFVRDDQPRADSCRQLALALRDEVTDLEQAGIRVIQLDEPAMREALPLRQADRQAYLQWAVACFRLATSGVEDETQIHTHMCYSEFNDIMDSIAAMDADVITIETSRSNMALLEAFENVAYPNDIGPGVYDTHSPNLPDEQSMVDLLRQAATRVPAERLWVNPDCGLKTRDWAQTRTALISMVNAAKTLRASL